MTHEIRGGRPPQLCPARIHHCHGRYSPPRDRRLPRVERTGGRPTASPPRLAAPLSRTCSRGTSGYICNPRALSSFPAAPHRARAKYARGKEAAARLSAGCQTIFTGDACRFTKSPAGGRRARIPRYRLIAEGVATTATTPPATRISERAFRNGA